MVDLAIMKIFFFLITSIQSYVLLKSGYIFLNY